MKITVKEFDILNEERIKNFFASEGQPYNNEFDELIRFIHDFSSSPDNEDAYKFLSFKTNKQYGRYVSFKNYVGLIQLNNGFQVEVLPKIDMAATAEETKKIFLNMLKTLKDFKGKLFNISDLSVEKMSIYDIFISIYLQEVLWLCKRGLKSTYVTIQENLTALKGKLILREQMRKNCVAKHRFFVEHDEYSLNRPENKLIKSTLLKLLKIAESQTNKKLCKDALVYFDSVDESTNYDSDFSKIVADRSTRDYEDILRWSKVFLKNKSFTSFSGTERSRALLFQMDKLFESYVGKYVKSGLYGYVKEATTQDKGYYLFDTPSKEFALRPDIVIKKNDGSILIMDTKWKSLEDVPKHNYGISQSDMYQMFAYSKKYSKPGAPSEPEICLLYPLNSEMKGHSKIFYSDGTVNVHVEFIDLSKPIENEVERLRLAYI